MTSRFHKTEGRLLAIALIAALAACTNIHDDSARTRTEGALAGAGLGAAAGAGIGAAVGGKNKSKAMLAGAAAGAIVGGVAGEAYGASVAKKKEGYAQTEDALAVRLKTTQRQLQDRHTFNLGLKYEIARHEQRLASLRAATNLAGREVEEFELRTTLVNRVAEIDRRARVWQETIDAHKAALRQAGADPRAAALRSDIDALAAEQAELLRQRKELMSITRRAR